MKDYHLYFMQQENGGPVKIGITNNLKSRVSTIQCGNPQKVNLLFSLPYPEEFYARKHEKYLHRLFEHLRISGEWFEPKPFLLERLEVIKHNGVDGLPEAQTTHEDQATHYEVFDLISDPLCEIHKSISNIHKQMKRIGKVHTKYRNHGDYQSCKYIMLELDDTMKDLRWRNENPHRKPING